MYKKINSAVTLLSYMKEKTYKGLPFELWDRYLWFYEPIVDLLSKPLCDKDFNNISLYSNERNGEIIGIAYTRHIDSDTYILLDTSDSDSIKEFAEDIKAGNCTTLKIQVNSLKTAEFVKNAIGTNYIPDTIKFYTSKCPYESCFLVKDVESGDGYLFRSEHLPDGWPEIDKLLEEGIRYFTINEADTSISACGLCYLTAFRAEVIAVGTVEQYRRRGYSKAVCSHAVKEALKKVSMATWTTDISNTASCATARSLGFIPFTELYDFKII